MYCPKCGHTEFFPTAPCPACDFRGQVGQIETFFQLKFLLNELETWKHLPPASLDLLRQRYRKQVRELEVELDLRPPPLDAKAALEARLEMDRQDVLLKIIPRWRARGVLDINTTAWLADRAERRIAELQDSLLDAPVTSLPAADELVLGRLRFLVELLDELNQEARIQADQAYIAAQAELRERIEEREIALGLRPSKAPKRAPERAPAAGAVPAPTTDAMPVPARRPRTRLTRERLWETLLSERTLQAMLFLGAGLLFAAAVSLVVWNWQAFPPWLQVAFLALFTGIFYGLGWYVRVRMNLRGSGIALSAVASLLVPLDFYAFYLSGGFPRDSWPQVWLLTSVICLGAYLLSVYLIQAEFFGYLVGLAAASVLSSGMIVLDISPDWQQASLAGLSLGLIIAAEGLHRWRSERWQVLVAPMWRVSLIGVGVILALHFGWRLIDMQGGAAFGIAQSVSWWLAGLVFTFGAGRYRSRSIGVAAAASFPLAMLFTQDSLFDLWQVHATWKALGLAALCPLYLWAGSRLGVPPGDGTRRSHARTAVRSGLILVIVSAAWSLLKMEVAAVVHPLLAATTGLAVVLWRRPKLAYFASLLLLSGSASLIASRGATLAQLGLAWALLAVLHVIVALLVVRRLHEKGQLRTKSEGHEKRERESGEEGRQAGLRIRRDYAAPVFVAGWIIAGLALLPPLISFEHGIFTYTLGNWIALNGWLALLAHSPEVDLQQVFATLTLVRRRYMAPRTSFLLFQWSASLPVPLWVWMAWGERLAGARLALALVPLAWGLLFFGGWLRRVRWAYGLPWITTAHLSLAVALLASLFTYDQPWMALTLLLAAGFYFAAAWLGHRKLWLLPGGLILPVGWLLILDWLRLAVRARPAALALMPLIYILAVALLERRRIHLREFLAPLYWLAQGIAAVAFILGLALLFPTGGDEPQYLWSAAADLLLALGFALHSWLFVEERSAHVAAWLAVFAGGLVALNFSRGSGRSALLVSLGAVVYILSERSLFWAGLRPQIPVRWQSFARRAWRLYRRPLLVAGWTVSAGAVFMALVRNLAILGGGRTRELWSVASLALVCGLYAASAYLFRRHHKASQRLAWLAASLVIAPWTLLSLQFWRAGWFQLPGYAVAWTLLALLELLIGAWLRARLQPSYKCWGSPPQVVAHLVMPFALLWGLGDSGVSSLTFGLALVFYLLAVFIDLRLWRISARYLYPAAIAIPLWSVYLLAHFAPDAPQTAYGTLILSFALPALCLGRRIERRQGSVSGLRFALPLYLLVYLVLLVGTALVAHERLVLIVALLFDTLILGLSAWIFRQPLWLYLASATFPAALILALIHWSVPASRHGWALIATGGLYLGVSYGLRALKSGRVVGDYATPLIAAAFTLVAMGLPNSSIDRPGAIVGYSAAALLYALSSAWLKQPLLVTPAAGLAIVPYWMAVLQLGIPPRDYGLALWPGIILSLALALFMDRRWGVQAGPLGPFPWYNPLRWPMAVAERLALWWAYLLFAMSYLGGAVSVVLSLGDPARLTLTLGLSAALYAQAVYRFQLRGWLLLAAGFTQLTALSAIRWAGLVADRPPGPWIALTFTPVAWLTALIGLYVQMRLKEGAPLNRKLWPVQRQVLDQAWRGWSRPLYMLLLVDLLSCQAATLVPTGAESAWVSLSSALLLALLASVWRSNALAYLSPALGALALAQSLRWTAAMSTAWPWALSLLALIYGLAGYLLRFLQHRELSTPGWANIWQQSLRRYGWLLSFVSLGLALVTGIDVIGLAVRSMLGRPPIGFGEFANVRMIVGVLAVLGLFYLAAAVVDQRRWLSYAALALLLSAWSLELLVIQGQRELQWYAIPAGIYLLGVAYLEWRLGSRELARWIDRVAILLLLGSSFWQSMGPHGGRYAVLMGLEALLLLWWGSARRLRLFLYAGVSGVTLDVAAQLVEPLLSANRWIVFLVAGVILVGLAILVERRLEQVKALSQELRDRLEDWG